MQPVRNNSNSSNNYSTYDIDQENRSRYDLLTDEQIDDLPEHEAKERLKNVTVVTNRLMRNLQAAEDDRKQTEKAYKDAIYDLSKNQAVANLAENQRNRNDFQVMETTTRTSLAQRIISIVALIITIAVTIVCAIL